MSVRHKTMYGLFLSFLVCKLSSHHLYWTCCQDGVGVKIFPSVEKKCVGGMSNVHCSRLMRKSQIWEIWEWARFSTGRGTARPLGGKNILINAEHSKINKIGIWVLYVSLITNYQTRHPVFTLCYVIKDKGLGYENRLTDSFYFT